MVTVPTTEPRSLHNIADDIVKTWPKVYFGAVPYVRAMRHIETVNDKFDHETGRDIVLYFLVNAKTWRGEDARRIKAELKGLLK